MGGALIGYLTGIVVSTGPLSVPLFLFYGFTKGAFLATEAASSLGLYVSKSITFERFGALTPDISHEGPGCGLLADVGRLHRQALLCCISKPDVFRLLMDGIMMAAGLSLLWSAAFS